MISNTHTEIEKLEGGKVQTTIHSRPIAYWNTGGRLQRITNSLQATGDPNLPIGVDELIQFRIRSRLAGNAPVIHFGTGKTHVRFTPLGTNNVDGVVNGQSITFHEAWNNADLRLTIAGHLLRKDVILRAGHPQAFAFRIDSHVGLNFNTLETADFRILQPALYDPNSSLIVPLQWVVSEQGGKIVLTTTLPPGNHAGKVLDPTLTLQPDANDGLDTWPRSSNSNASYGVNDELRVGEDKDNVDINRGLLKFSGLSAIRADATVYSSVLSLWLAQAGSSGATNNRTVRAYRQLRAWVEGTTEDPSTAGATWDNYECAGPTAWATAGGFGAADCEQTDIGTHGMLTADAINTEHTLTLTAAKVQEWISGTLANNGLLVKADTEAADLYRFHSSDGANAGFRPKLVTIWAVVETRSQTIKISGSVLDIAHRKDSITQTVKIAGSKTDIQDYTDSTAQTVKIAGSRTDLQTYLPESRSQTILMALSKTDAQTWLEGLSQTIKVIGSETDRKSYKEPVTQTVKIALSEADLQDYIDNVTSTLLIAPSAVDLQTYNPESLVQTILMSLSVTDAKRYIETLSQQILMSLSLAEQMHFCESLAQTILIDPSVADLQSYTDALTQTILITGSVEDVLPIMIALNLYLGNRLLSLDLGNRSLDLNLGNRLLEVRL